MLHERVSNGLAWLAAIAGTAGVTGASSVGRPAFAALQPSDVTAWTVALVSAASAAAGVATLLIGSVSKARREAKAADDLAFATSREGKLAALQASFDAYKATAEQTAAITQQQRDFFKSRLEAILRQNEDQAKAISVMAGNVVSVGHKVKAAMSDDGEGAAEAAGKTS